MKVNIDSITRRYLEGLDSPNETRLTVGNFVTFVFSVTPELRFRANALIHHGLDLAMTADNYQAVTSWVNTVLSDAMHNHGTQQEHINTLVDLATAHPARGIIITENNSEPICAFRATKGHQTEWWLYTDGEGEVESTLNRDALTQAIAGAIYLNDAQFKATAAYRNVTQVKPGKSAEAEPEDEGVYSPLALQGMLMRAYENQDQTRMTYHHAEHTLWEAERELTAREFAIHDEPEYKELKNDPSRKDYTYAGSQEQALLVGIARTDALGAKLDLERAQAEVELARALLRVAELAAGMEKRR